MQESAVVNRWGPRGVICVLSLGIPFVYCLAFAVCSCYMSAIRYGATGVHTVAINQCGAALELCCVSLTTPSRLIPPRFPRGNVQSFSCLMFVCVFFILFCFHLCVLVCASSTTSFIVFISIFCAFAITTTASPNHALMHFDLRQVFLLLSTPFYHSHC